MLNKHQIYPIKTLDKIPLRIINILATALTQIDTVSAIVNRYSVYLTKEELELIQRGQELIDNAAYLIEQRSLKY